MNPLLTATVVALYFLLLLLVGRLTSRKTDNNSFFVAGRTSPWYLIAFGMIGTSISGVTFISVPGEVGAKSFYYLQFVAGNFLGYFVVAFILLPLYYKMNLTSIYAYLDERYGKRTHKTGSFFFLLSRTIGSAARLYLVAVVFQTFIFDAWGFPFWLSVLLSVGLILAYSIKGGVKTIIWTDTLQTVFLVASLIITIVFLNRELGFNLLDSIKAIQHSTYSQVIFMDVNSPLFFWKQFLSGIFITIAMVGLDQDLMQKNLTCKNLKEAQKNMVVFSGIFIGVVLLFLCLGALMYMYAEKFNFPLPMKEAANGLKVVRGDYVLPTLALQHNFPMIFSFIFIIGLTAAAFASADSALTALPTSFCVDFLGFSEKESNAATIRSRNMVHIGFSVLIILVIYLFKAFIKENSILSAIFILAGYTYGPLLGLYSFGIFSKRQVSDKIAPWICLAAPLILFGLEIVIHSFWPNYQIGFERLIINGLLIHIFLYIISRPQKFQSADSNLSLHP